MVVTDAPQVSCSSEKGFAAVATVRGRVPTPPGELFELLCGNDAATFVPRAVKERRHYELLGVEGERDGRGALRTYRAAYLSAFSFGPYHGECELQMLVTQDDANRVMTMRLERPGFLKRFEMEFSVLPPPSEGADGADNMSLVQVVQKITPRVPAFDPLTKRIVQGINRSQAVNTLEDVRLHAARHAPPRRPSGRSRGGRAMSPPPTPLHVP